MCIQFRSYLRAAKFTLRTDHKSLVWLHRFKDTEGMMARWLHTLQQFQFSIVHRAGRDHGNADGLSRVPTSPCGQCARVDCPPVDTAIEVVDQPFDTESVGDSEDADLVPLQSGEDWMAHLNDDLSRPASQSGENFCITALQLQDSTCIGCKWRDLAEEEFSRLGIAVVGTQTSAETIISDLSYVIVWRPFGS